MLAMQPNGSTGLEREVHPAELKSDGAQPGEKVAPNADGEIVLSVKDDVLSNATNGSIAGAHSAKPDEKVGSQDPSLGTNGTVAVQGSPATTPSPSHQASKIPNQTVDGSTFPVQTPFLYPHPSAHPHTQAPLSPEQEAKYNTLLSTARSWTTIPSSTKSHEAIPLNSNEKLWLTRECLLRYLRAAKWAVPTATTRLQATLTWRREYGVDSHTAEYISEENETGKQVILGYDTAGRPCLYLNPHKQNTKEPKKQLHHLVFMLERCIDLMAPGVETLALLVNFKDSRRGQNASVSQGREVLSILQNHYPERLGRALVIEVPWLIWGFFKAISPFIDPLTREKLKFDEDLRLLVPPEQLIKHFKGDVEFEYVHEKYWTALNELAEGRRRDMRERWEKAGSLVGESEAYLKGDGESVGTGAGAETGLEKTLTGTKIDD